MSSVHKQIEEIISTFASSVDQSKRVIVETFKHCSVTQTIDNCYIPDKSVLQSILLPMNNNDIIYIIIKLRYDEEIRLNSKANDDNINVFLYELSNKKNLGYFDDVVTIEISIQKGKGEISIYFPDVFFTNLSDGSLENILNTFKLAHSDNYSFSKLTYELQSGFFNGIIRKENINKRNELVNFLNASEFPYYPEDFIIVSQPENELVLNFFKKLTIVFCIISFCDSSHIKDTGVSYKIKGYKSLNGFLVFDDIDVEEYSEWIRLYNWIYSEGIASDKVGITRNIISLYCSNNLCISSEIFDSIQSGFNMYLKENVGKYVEIRNKITDTLFDISNELTKKVDSIVDNLKVLFMIFLSFYFAAFVMTAITSSAIKELFNPKMTSLTLILQLLSVLFLLILNINIVLSRRHYDKLIENLKKEYDGILDIHDIENIFSKTFSFKFLKRNNYYKQIWFSVIWIIIIALFFSATIELCDTALRDLPVFSKVINKLTVFF